MLARGKQALSRADLFLEAAAVANNLFDYSLEDARRVVELGLQFHAAGGPDRYFCLEGAGFPSAEKDQD